jgi:hypothetical protein
VVFLAEILWFLLIQRVLVDHNLAMECPWGVPTSKVLCESVEWIRRSGVGFGGLDPQVLFILSSTCEHDQPSDRLDRWPRPVRPVTQKAHKWFETT